MKRITNSKTGVKKKTNDVKHPSPSSSLTCFDGVPSHPISSAFGQRFIEIGLSGPWGTLQFNSSHPLVSEVYLHSPRISLGRECPVFLSGPSLCSLLITCGCRYINCKFASEANLKFMLTWSNGLPKCMLCLPLS